MILVTGGTGFLGSVLVKRLIDAGKGVIATKREQSIIPDSLKSSSLIQWVNAEVTDYFALQEVFPHVRQVYHCAAQISSQSADARSMMHTNIEGTKHIVNLCLEHGARLVHVSSIAALGPNKNNIAQDENAKWERTSRTSSYSVSKYDSEMEVWRGIVEGLDAVIVNPSIIMGRGIGSGRVAANAIFDQVKKGLKVYPMGSVGVVDVEDVAAIMVILMDSEISGERFILNSENLTNRQLLTNISTLLNKPAPTIPATRVLLSVAWRLSKVVALLLGKPSVLTKDSARAASELLAYDNTKIVQATGYRFKTVQETLESVYQTYYLKN